MSAMWMDTLGRLYRSPSEETPWQSSKVLYNISGPLATINILPGITLKETLDLLKFTLDKVYEEYNGEMLAYVIYMSLSVVLSALANNQEIMMWRDGEDRTLEFLRRVAEVWKDTDIGDFAKEAIPKRLALELG